MKDSEILAEIDKAIERMMADGKPAPQSWIVQAVVAEHQSIEGADSDFYTCCAYGHTAALVRRALQREKSDELRDDAQLLLPGFQHLHRRYSIIRDDEQMVVPIEAMTHAEGQAKAQEYIRMAHGLNEHADELLRYFAQRVAA